MGKGNGDSNKQHGDNDLLNCSSTAHSEYVSICLTSGIKATNSFPAVFGE